MRLDFQEVQIHGPISLEDHVQSIHIPTADYHAMDKNLLDHICEAYGIDIVLIDPLFKPVEFQSHTRQNTRERVKGRRNRARQSAAQMPAQTLTQVPTQMLGEDAELQRVLQESLRDC